LLVHTNWVYYPQSCMICEFAAFCSAPLGLPNLMCTSSAKLNSGIRRFEKMEYYITVTLPGSKNFNQDRYSWNKK